MNAFAAELERQLEDSENYSQLGFEERLGLLVDSEWNCRQNNKLNRYIKNARFSAMSATMKGIEYIAGQALWIKRKCCVSQPVLMLMKVITLS